MPNLSTHTKEFIETDVLTDLEEPCHLIMWNDEVNTFEWVIETLIDICDQTPEQAEQCAILVHYTGKCTVKTGSYNDLKPQCSSLLDAGLSAEIQ